MCKIMMLSHCAKEKQITVLEPMQKNYLQFGIANVYS